MAYYPTTPGYNPVSVPPNNGTFGNYQNGYAQSNYGASMMPYQQSQNWYPNMYGTYGGSQTSVNNQNMKWVQGRAGAEAYQLEPNSRAVLFDSESQTFYIKEVGPDGRPQPLMANLAASQNAQTSRILADNAAQTVALEQYLNPTPVPAYMVQNPNCCGNFYNGCGCGYNG